MSFWIVNFTAVVWLLLIASCDPCKGYNLAVVSGTSNNVTAKQLVKLDTDGEEIIGVTPLGDRLYVVCVSSDKLYVFKNNYPYERIAVMELSELSGMSPGDGVSDEGLQSLYVIDWRPASAGNTRVWSVNPATWEVSYLINATGWTGTLSVNSAHDILGVSGNGKVNIYSVVNGDLTILDAVSDPQHAVQKNDRYIVSQGWTQGTPHRVVEMDSSGNVLREFGGNQPGNGTYELNWPRYLALGCGNGVMVADYWNRRVVHLNDTLGYVQDILSHETTSDVGWPQRMFCVKGAEGWFHLYVAMAESPLEWHSK